MRKITQLDPSVKIPKRWGLFAAALLDMEESGGWKKKGFASFGLYLGSLAIESGRLQSSLWRELAAGRLYNQLRNKLNLTKEKYPQLDDPGVEASPESLELVAKISRVAPIKLVEDLERRAMSGEISRRTLRVFWETYRPVMDKRTKRGRRKSALLANKKDLKMRRSLPEANSLAQIVQSGPAWLGVDGEAYVYRVVQIAGNDVLCHLYPSVPQAVVLLARDEQSSLELHGVEAGYNIESNKMLIGYDSYNIGVDFLWVATSKPLSPVQRERLAEEVGLLLTTPDGIKVLWEAKVIDGSFEKREELLKTLLREASRK